MSSTARSRPVTMRDVAAAAGVSIATASKALKGGYPLRAETQERVRQAAEALNFLPNPGASILMTGRTGSVGVLTTDLEGRFSLPVMMGAEDAFGTDEISVFLADARGDGVREQHNLRNLLSRRVDGLILVGDTTNPRPSLSASVPVPVVYAYNPSEDPSDISVVVDNYGAGHIAAQHLVSCGRRRIGYIAGDTTFGASHDRVRGAIDALAERDLELVGGDAMFGSWSEDWGRGAMRTMLAAHPDIDAVLCGADQLARGAMDAAREHGSRIPEDIAVIGNDNWGLLAEGARPPLTSIDMNLQEVGRRAAQLLFAAIDGQPSVGVHRVSTRLVARGSTVPTQ